jgi:MoxR-like ATPase
VVPARVHTVIAATNYLRVNEVTEAVLDRFIFKSLFTPRKEPYIQYEIAQRHLEYKGRPTMPARRIPYETLKRTTDIVLGQDPEHRVEIPLHVMFFANSVIRLYETQRNRLLRERPQDHPHLKDFYISPRTYTRAMDLLRAVAFMRGRLDVQREDVERLWYLFTTVGVSEERDLFLKAHETIFKQLAAGKAFEQIQRMLEFQELLELLRQNPALMQRPVTQIEGVAIRRTLREWARETLGLDDAPVEHNRRLLEEYFRSFEPLTEEIADFRRQQEQDIHALFHPSAHIWS